MNLYFSGSDELLFTLKKTGGRKMTSVGAYFDCRRQRSQLIRSLVFVFSYKTVQPSFFLLFSYLSQWLIMTWTDSSLTRDTARLELGSPEFGELTMDVITLWSNGMSASASFPIALTPMSPMTTPILLPPIPWRTR